MDYTYEDMEIKIKNGDAFVKYESRKCLSNTKLRVKITSMGEKSYKLCAKCAKYKDIDYFLYRKEGRYDSYCRKCNSENLKKEYKSNVNYYIRSRWKATISRVTGENEHCSLDDFTEFFYMRKCIYTERTLYDDWVNPSDNFNLRLEVGYILPISKGGTSEINNLQILPRVINALKFNIDTGYIEETMEFLIKHRNLIEDEK